MRSDGLLGLVLCGGESRRMGQDKGLLLKEDTPWARQMGNKLQALQLPVMYSINPSQQAAYSAILPADLLIVDALELAGPLNGLLSAHRRYPGKDLLLLACDMPDLDHPTIEKLIRTYGSRQGAAPAEFFVYHDGPFAQPFCAIYTAAGLAAVYSLALQQALPDRSLQSILRNGKTWWIGIDRPEAFRNYNSL